MQKLPRHLKIAASSVTSRTTKISGTPQRSAADDFAQAPHIRDLISRIVRGSKEPDNKLIDAAAIVKELRGVVEAGKSIHGLTWLEWARKHLSIADKNILFLLDRLAEASTRKHAELILVSFRERQANRQKDWRQRQREKSAKDESEDSRSRRLPQERRDLIQWAKAASLTDVRKALSHIRRVYQP